MNKIKAYSWDRFLDFVDSTQDEYVCKISSEEFLNELETDGIFHDFTSDFDLTGSPEEVNMFGTITCYAITGGTEEEPEEKKVFMEFELTLYNCKLTITKTE